MEPVAAAVSDNHHRLLLFTHSGPLLSPVLRGLQSLGIEIFDAVREGLKLA